jgi:hypothetical protein
MRSLLVALLIVPALNACGESPQNALRKAFPVGAECGSNINRDSACSWTSPSTKIFVGAAYKGNIIEIQYTSVRGANDGQPAAQTMANLVTVLAGFRLEDLNACMQKSRQTPMSIWDQLGPKDWSKSYSLKKDGKEQFLQCMFQDENPNSIYHVRLLL